MFGQWCILNNKVSSFFGEHQGWGIDVSIGYIGHDLGIHDTNSFHAMNLETFWVHYGLGSGSYRTTAGGMIGCFTISSNPLKNFFIRVDRRPRRYFIPAEFVKSRLSKNLPCSVDGFHPFFLVLKGRKRIHSQRRFGKGIFTSNFY